MISPCGVCDREPLQTLPPLQPLPKRKHKGDKPLRSMRPRTPANPPSLATPAKADPCSNKEDRKSYIPLQPSLYTLKTYFMRILVRTRRIPNGDQEALKKCVFTTVNYCSTQKATLSQLDYCQLLQYPVDYCQLLQYPEGNPQPTRLYTRRCVFTTVNYCSTQKATLSQLDFTHHHKEGPTKPLRSMRSYKACESRF